MLETRHEGGTLCNEDLEKRLRGLRSFDECICETMISPNCQSGFIKGALEKAFGMVGCLAERLHLHSAVCGKDLKESDLYNKSFAGIVDNVKTANECMYVALFTTDQDLKYKVFEKALDLTSSCRHCAWIYKEIPSENPLKKKADHKIRKLLDMLGKSDYEDLSIIIDTIDDKDDILVQLAWKKWFKFYKTKSQGEDN